MYKLVKDIIKGDRVIYDRVGYEVTNSYPDKKSPQKHILEFWDTGEEGALLGLKISANQCLEVITDQEISPEAENSRPQINLPFSSIETVQSVLNEINNLEDQY